MKRFITILALFAVAVLMLSNIAESSTVRRKISDNYTLLNMIEKSDIVCTGTVVTQTGVVRYNIRPGRSRLISSDITVRVDTMIKGEPNLGENHVIFMIEGGTAYVPELDEVITLEISNNLNFEPGEKALIFLSKHPGGKWYAKYPYDRLHIHTDFYGKRPIKDNKVMMLYKRNSQSLIGMKMPVEMTTVLGKAYVENKEAAIAVENQIKTLARTHEIGADLTDAFVLQIKTSAQQIIDDAREED